MKKILIFTFSILFLFTCSVAYAECTNPVGSSFVLSDGTRLVFAQGWTSKSIILQAYAEGEFVGGVPCEWHQDTCEAALETEPVIYLRVQDGYVEISMEPRFTLEY